MVKNMFLFTGEETYLLDKELTRRKENFAQKFGQDSIFGYDTQNFESSQVLQAIFGGGLFTSKKLVIIKGLPLDTNVFNKIAVSKVESFTDEFMARGDQLPADVLVVFVSYKPDKRVKFYKFLDKTAEKKTFAPLREPQIKSFDQEQLDGYKIDTQALDCFILKVGNNLYRISHELEKLMLRSKANNQSTITIDMIDEVVFGQVEADSFAFFDHLFTQPKKSISVLDDMHKEGADWNQAAGMLYWGLKLYLFLVDLYQQGIKDTKQIASMTKMHPFAVAKNIKHIDRLIENSLFIKSLYRQLIELDAGIKTGKYPDTYFWLGIKKMILER